MLNICTRLNTHVNKFCDPNHDELSRGKYSVGSLKATEVFAEEEPVLIGDCSGHRDSGVRTGDEWQSMPRLETPSAQIEVPPVQLEMASAQFVVAAVLEGPSCVGSGSDGVSVSDGGGSEGLGSSGGGVGSVGSSGGSVGAGSSGGEGDGSGGVSGSSGVDGVGSEGDSGSELSDSDGPESPGSSAGRSSLPLSLPPSSPPGMLLADGPPSERSSSCPGSRRDFSFRSRSESVDDDVSEPDLRSCLSELVPLGEPELLLLSSCSDEESAGETSVLALPERSPVCSSCCGTRATPTSVPRRPMHAATTGMRTGFGMLKRAAAGVWDGL